ncbi:hypothetical protein KDV78_20320, partial [Providencia stuartii]
LYTFSLQKNYLSSAPVLSLLFNSFLAFFAFIE